MASRCSPFSDIIVFSSSLLLHPAARQPNRLRSDVLGMRFVQTIRVPGMKSAGGDRGAAVEAAPLKPHKSSVARSFRKTVGRAARSARSQRSGGIWGRNSLLIFVFRAKESPKRRFPEIFEVFWGRGPSPLFSTHIGRHQRGASSQKPLGQGLLGRQKKRPAGSGPAGLHTGRALPLP